MQRTQTIPVPTLASARLSAISALPRPYVLEVASGWPELRARVPQVPPSAIVLVDCTPGRAAERMSLEVRSVLTAFPSVAFVAAVDVPSVAPEWIARLFAAGASDILDLSVENTPELAARRLYEAHARPFKRRVEEGLSPYVSARARTIIRAASHVTARGGGAGELALHLRVTPATVAEWTDAAALPPPRRLQAWMRVLLAASLLEEPLRTIAGIAASCGYTTDRALRRAFKGLVGVEPRSARGGGAFGAAMSKFNDDLAELRENHRAQPGRG